MRAKKRIYIGILCLMAVLFASPIVIKAVSGEAFFSGGSTYGVLRLTTSSIFASNASTYDDEELFDPAVYLYGVAKNSNYTPLGYVEASGYGICQKTTNSLINVYRGTCDYKVNGNKVLTLNTTIND